MGVFFGEKVEVPPPPEELYDVMKRAKALGWVTLAPHYLFPFAMKNQFF